MSGRLTVAQCGAKDREHGLTQLIERLICRDATAAVFAVRDAFGYLSSTLVFRSNFLRQHQLGCGGRVDAGRGSTRRYEVHVMSAVDT
jgi:hypothetical protein